MDYGIGTEPESTLSSDMELFGFVLKIGVREIRGYSIDDLLLIWGVRKHLPDVENSQAQEGHLFKSVALSNAVQQRRRAGGRPFGKKRDEFLARLDAVELPRISQGGIGYYDSRAWMLISRQSSKNA